MAIEKLNLNFKNKTNPPTASDPKINATNLNKMTSKIDELVDLTRHGIDLIYDGKFNQNESASMQHNIYEYKYLLIMPNDLGTFAMCPVFEGIGYLRGICSNPYSTTGSSTSTDESLFCSMCLQIESSTKLKLLHMLYFAIDKTHNLLFPNYSGAVKRIYGVR